MSRKLRHKGSLALDAVSNYERHRNIDTAQQRFPDLKRRGCSVYSRRDVRIKDGKPIPINGSD